MVKLMTVLLVLAIIVIIASANPSTAAAGPCGDVYLVREGDTLQTIADLCGVDEQQLLLANPGLTGLDELTPGRAVFIPRSELAAVQAHAIEADQAAVIPNTGDTLVLPDQAAQPTPLVVQSGEVQTYTYAQPAAIPVTGAYTIQPGDTLSALAIRFGTSIEAIMAVNPQITDADVIVAGRALTLPGGAVPIPNTGGQPIPTTGSYTIQPGDTLTAIALRYGTSVEAIMAVNPQITDPDVIVAGRALTLPGSSPIPNTGGQNANVYVVREGDTLISVADRLGISLETLLAHNPNINRLTVGQALNLPGLTVVPTATAPVVTPAIPVTGPQVVLQPALVYAGDEVEAIISGFPVNAALDVTISPLGGGNGVTYAARTDANGVVRARMSMPGGATPGSAWVAVVTEPLSGVSATSNPVAINGTAVQPTLSPPVAAASSVQIYLVERGAGNVACGDRLAPALRPISGGADDLSTALNALLALGEQEYGPTRLYNALYASQLALDRLEVEGEHADVYLTGTFQANDVCDLPRMRSQIEGTARHYGVETATIFVNGQPVE